MICQMHGESEQMHLWHGEPPRPKGLRHADVIPHIRRRQNPGLVGQLCEINRTTARPPAVQSGSYHQWIVEEIFEGQIVRSTVVRRRRVSSQENEVEFS